MGERTIDECKKIIVTPGEPAGIGPDILIKVAQQPQQAQLIAVADPALIKDRAQRLNLPITLSPFDPQQNAAPCPAGHLQIIPITSQVIPEPGKGDPSNARYVLSTLEQATNHCTENIVDALVTGPINKHLINLGCKEANIDTNFTGHTEFLAALTHTARVVMMLANTTSNHSNSNSINNSSSNPNNNKADHPLRVALATTHMPLRAVADAINASMLEETLVILHKDLKHKFGINNPRILVCGLNPHAGENGDLGHEEQDIINPCLAKLRKKGIDVSDALPADTLFTEHHLKHADVVLAMFHDQGLPVLKSHGFGNTVNITLGLPIIRTSVDHGTAFDLAGTGKACENSLQAAIDCAITIASASQH